MALNKGGANRYINRNFTTVYTDATDGRRVLSAKPLQQLDFEGGLRDTNRYFNNRAAYGDDIASIPYNFKYRLH